MKFIITILIIYFIVRGISLKPWLSKKQTNINQSQSPQANPSMTSNPNHDDEYVDYEEVE